MAYRTMHTVFPVYPVLCLFLLRPVSDYIVEMIETVLYWVKEIERTEV